MSRLAKQGESSVEPGESKIRSAIEDAKDLPPDQTDEGGTPKCPLTALGQWNGRYFFLTQAGELRDVSGFQMNYLGLLSLFDGDVEWLFGVHGHYNGQGNLTGFNASKAAGNLMRQCRRAGLFDPATPVRGPGVWREGTAVVAHCGDALYADGEWGPSGVKRNGFIYRAAPPVPRHAAQPAVAEAGRDLLEAVRPWRFREEVGAELIVGFIGQAMLGGATRWRAHALVTGPRGSGKSWLLELVGAALGGAAHPVQTDFTEAGLRQSVTGEARAILLDESEQDTPGGRSRLQRLTELLRHTSGSDGARTVRGSVGGDARHFEVTGCFYITAILSEPLKPQDRARILEIELGPLARGVESSADADRVLAAIAEVRERSAGLRARGLYGWRRFHDTFAVYRGVFLAAGCDARQGDQYATVLAGRDLLMRDDVPCAEKAGEEVKRFAFLLQMVRLDEEEGEGAACLNHLFGSSVAGLWRSGELRTAGEIILEAMEPGAFDVRRTLGKIGLRIENSHDRERAVLLVANNHPGLKKIVAGERWERGIWGPALRYLPGAFAWPVPARFAGTQQRATAIPAAFLPRPDESGEEGNAAGETLDDPL